MTQSLKYFAYGSNCNPAVMDRKSVRFTARTRATLPGYRLLFNKRALREALPDEIGFANVELAEGHVVEGILYDLVAADLDRLDRSERYPDHYTRVEVTVATEASSIECFVYRAQPDKTADGLRPSRNYLSHILEARDFLSHSYFEALDSAQTYEGPCAVCSETLEVWFVRNADRVHWVCQPCREARHVWGTARGRPLSVPEASAVMQYVQERGGFPSIPALIAAAMEARVLEP